MSVWNHVPAFPPILVPATTLANADNKPEELIMAVVACVHCLRARGRYELDELSPHAMQLYLAYSYYLELPGGGHSQYVHNMRVRAGRDEARAIFSGAHAGLLAMGATAQADILHTVLNWVDANPEDGSELAGLEGGVAEELKPLDGLFVKAEQRDPLVKRAAHWITGWSDLRPIGDAGFEAACVALAETNPKRLNRISASRIEKFHEAATDPFRVCLGLAAASAEGSEIVLRVISRHEIAIDGELDVAWLIGTDRGLRYSLADEAGIAVYEAANVAGEDSPITQADIGAVIGRVANGQIDAFRAGVADLPVGAAADLLLRRAQIDDENAVLSATGMVRSASLLGRMLGRADAKPAFYLVAAGRIFMMSFTKRGFVLFSMENDQSYGPVSVAEARQHAKDVQELGAGAGA